MWAGSGRAIAQILARLAGMDEAAIILDQLADPNTDLNSTPRAVQRARWWREVLVVAAFYGLYTLVRDLHGAQMVSTTRAFTNAKRIIRLEHWTGIYRELALQREVLDDRWLIRLSDDFYGTLHFIVTGAVLLMLFFWFPTKYRAWRNTLALTTGLALIGFYFFPLAPPRLLPSSYGFVDTLQKFGGLWNFSSGPVNDVSNQYAAMPSLHTAWSMWSACALASVLRPWWAKIIVFVYPAYTIFAIVVTANHYFADAIAGLLLFWFSALITHPVTAALDRRAYRTEAKRSARRPDPPERGAPDALGAVAER
jgi:membrane-associated phospholipid phosphatase